MKQKYEFYLTGEEKHQMNIHFTFRGVMTFFCLLFLFESFAFMSLYGKLIGKTLEDKGLLVLFVLTIILGLSMIPVLILEISRKNFSPTNEHWDYKHECVIDGNTMTIRLKGVDRIFEEKFVIKKTKETKAGTVYYKSNNFYVVIPHRVKPTTME